MSLLALSLALQGQAVTPDFRALAGEVNADSLRSTIDHLVSFGTRHTLSTTRSPDRGIGAARRWVKRQMERYAAASNGRMEVFFDTFTVKPDGRRIDRPVTMKNVVGVLHGDPADDRVIIISGHLDSRNSSAMDSVGDAPGANDDGSGVAVVLELARLMSRHEYSATIMFVAFSGEEQGLYGSTHMARMAREQGWNILAVLNNDMVSNSYSSETRLFDNTHVRVFSEGVPAYETEDMRKTRQYLSAENDSRARQLARYVKMVGEPNVDQLEVVLVYRKDRFLRGGDHTPFSREGFPAVRICEMNENYDHQHQDIRTENGIQYGDLPEFQDFEYLRKNAALNYVVATSLALSPFEPRNVTVDVSRLTNTTTLRWDPPEKGPAAVGYFVLMRPTYSPVWEKEFLVEGTEVTLPYSKDNYFFAVQSAGQDGCRSLPVLPLPKR